MSESRVVLDGVPRVRLPSEIEDQVDVIMEILEDVAIGNKKWDDKYFSVTENNDLKARIKYEIKMCLNDMKSRARLL